MSLPGCEGFPEIGCSHPHSPAREKVPEPAYHQDRKRKIYQGSGVWSNSGLFLLQFL